MKSDFSRAPLRTFRLRFLLGTVGLKFSAQLVASCQKSTAGRSWLHRLPDAVQTLARRWTLTLDTPIENEVSCSWVAPATLPDGTRAVLKIGMPHMEGMHEIEGLRFWNGDATARLLLADETLGAMLLERCEPGTPLREVPESEQDAVAASLLRRLWRSPSQPHPFRPLSALLQYWSEETIRAINCWPDPGLVREGLQLFRELPQSAPSEVLLATDLHAGNILRAQREPWLVIDPKPFVGDPACDATQHLFNCATRLRSDPKGLIGRFAELLGVDAERVRLWTFARAAAEPRNAWRNEEWIALTQLLAP